LGEQLNARIGEFDKRVEARLEGFEERVNIRLDRMESVVYETNSNFHTLPADFNELRSEIRERFKEPA
jgi:hypothetical protein